MEEIEGEQRDHPHHRGVWFSHGEVNGVDFWANEPGQRGRGNKGVIALDAIRAVGAEGSRGWIEAAFGWLAPDGTRLVTENRTMAFGRSGRSNFVDFDIVLTADADSVHFGDTKGGHVRCPPGDGDRGASLPCARHCTDRHDPECRGAYYRGEHLGEALAMGRLFGHHRRQADGRRNLRPSTKPQASDLLARPGVRSLRSEHFRRARLPR